MAKILPSVLGRVASGPNLTIIVGQGDLWPKSYHQCWQGDLWPKSYHQCWAGWHVAQILPSVLGRWPVAQMSASGKNINTAILLALKTVASVSYNQHSVKKKEKKIAVLQWEVHRDIFVVQNYVSLCKWSVFVRSVAWVSDWSQTSSICGCHTSNADLVHISAKKETFH